MSIFLLLMCLWIMPLYGDAQQITSPEWTWLYKKNCTYSDRIAYDKKKSVVFSYDTVSPFTQLIVSWNAVRPEQGYFSFYVQVRDAQTKQWGTWHHMVDWGKDIQQSYASKSDGFSLYAHVRLEVENKKHADAFKIKIESEKSASLSLLHGVFGAVSDFTLFKPEMYKNNNDVLASVHLSGIPLIAQLALDHDDKTRICSPVSCAMLISCISGTLYSPIDCAVKVFDSGLGVYGSWPCNTAHAFDQTCGKVDFCVRRMNSFADLYQQLMNKRPVVVSVRGNLPGALKPFPHGHLMLVVGWDNETHEVLCHDPAAETDDAVFKRYALEPFLRAWECSHRLAYVADVKNSR